MTDNVDVRSKHFQTLIPWDEDIEINGDGGKLQS
jgi:hypothetical protein